MVFGASGERRVALGVGWEKPTDARRLGFGARFEMVGFAVMLRDAGVSHTLRLLRLLAYAILLDLSEIVRLCYVCLTGGWQIAA